MFKKISLLIYAMALVCIINAQNPYYLKDFKIGFSSPISLKANTSSSNTFETDGIKIQFSTLGGMIGISGLTGSLDSYATSYGFQSVGNSSAIKLNNLNGARCNASTSNQSVILVMFATINYKNHFICEAYFSPSKKSVVETIVSSLYYGEKNENISDNNTNNDNNNEDNNVNNTDNNENNNQNTGIMIGSKAPDFMLTDINGKNISLSDLKGKTVLLDFWGTWCGPCIKLIPKLKELYTKYKNQNFEILSIANDNDQNKWKNMVSNKGMTWTNVIDLTEKVVNQYQIKAYPTLMLIDKNGVFISIAASESDVERYFAGNNTNDNNNTNQDDNNTNNNSNDYTNNNSNDVVSPIKNTHLNGSAIEKMMWQILSTYNPDGYIILDDYEKAPSSYEGVSTSGSTDFTQWIDGTEEKDIVKSANTVVHETCHGYTGKLHLKLLQDAGKPVDGKYSTFYVGNHIGRLVKHTEVYTTDEINAIFPQILITSRYETYVYPSEKIMGSQQDGAYGLLDELNAYYWGTRTAFDLYGYFKKKNNTPDGWGEFFTDFYGTYYAYLEFKAYIIIYLIHAKNNHSTIYNEIVANKDFTSAFQKIDENWWKLLVDFKKVRQTIFDELKAKGNEVKEDGEYVYINGTGRGNFSKIYNTFKTELMAEKYQTIARSVGLKNASGPDMFN